MNEMWITFIILIITTIAFIIGRWRSDFVAIGALLAIALLGIVTPQEALAGFSNSIVIMITGLFVVGAGIFNTGLANKLGNQLIKLGGQNETKTLIIVMLTVGIFSAFISNTGTVAIMIPVVISMALQMKVSPSVYLIPLAFASSLGGVLTLIGTPPNLVVNETLIHNNMQPFHFFGFSPIGIVALLVGTIFMVLFGRKLLQTNSDLSSSATNHLSPSELAGVYKIYDRLHVVRITENSAMRNKNLIELSLTEKYGVTVVTTKKKTLEMLPFQPKAPHRISAKEALKENDILLIFGKKESVDQLSEDYLLEVLTEKEEDVQSILFSNVFGLTEVLITPQSSFINKNIKEIQFRSKYHCNVLAINRRGKYIQSNLSSTKLRVGDALIVHGAWKDIELMDNEQQNIVVVGKISEEAGVASASGKAWIAALIMLFMLVMMSTEWISPVIAVVAAAFLMVATGCLRSVNEAYQKINWESVVLIAAMLPLATALEKTGGVTYISSFIVDLLGSHGPYAILAGFYVLTMIFSQFISNTATAVIFAPVAITSAQALQLSPYPLLMCVAVAASMAFSTPVASPTNAMVMSAGGYKFSDYVRVGVPLQIILSIIMILLIPLIYPF
mgnify:CR=1 FL=1